MKLMRILGILMHYAAELQQPTQIKIVLQETLFSALNTQQNTMDTLTFTIIACASCVSASSAVMPMT